MGEQEKMPEKRARQAAPLRIWLPHYWGPGSLNLPVFTGGSQKSVQGFFPGPEGIFTHQF